MFQLVLLRNNGIALLEQAGQMSGTTATQLLEEYVDPSWRSKFVDITDLIEVLNDCIISNDYQIPDDLYKSIALTQAGSDLKSRLIRKEEVSAKEAHLMCALTVGHNQLYVDIDGTDIDALCESISSQILKNRIRFPFIFGRFLYDAFASMFEEEKDSLTSEETIELLEKIPRGVFQYGRFIVGPNGISVSNHSRSLRFSKRVPAFHCSDPVCRHLHSVFLSTGHNAPINAQRSKLIRLLEAESQPESDWAGFAMEISRSNDAYYGAHWIAPVVSLIGDAFGDEELESLMNLLGISTKAYSRENVVEQVLMSSDKELVSAIDSLVHENKIEIPVGEVRLPVSTAHLKSGAYRLSPQLGLHGVRFVSRNPGLPTLRERDLIDRLYLTGNPDERHELDWQLRAVDGVSLERRLDEYLRNHSPAEALSRLVLARNASAVAASEIVGLGDIDHLSDEDLISRLVWKLGFDDESAEDSHSEFWRQHEKLSSIVQTWLGAGPGDANEFRGNASVYFAVLEGVLANSLAFATWVLLNDHLSEARPFSYDSVNDQKHGFELLQTLFESHPKTQKERLNFRLDDKLTIFPLVRGFEILSQVLQGISQKSADYLRAKSTFPEYADRGGLQHFPFRHLYTFLDLAEHSQIRIINGLAEIGSILNASALSKTRNDYSHYRRTSPELAEMEKTLESVGRAVRLIENLGFGLNLCQLSSESSDRWGRQTVEFSGPRRLSHSFARPSSLEWAGLPMFTESQYLVRSAAFDDANEILRFVPRYQSPYADLWDTYPNPRKRAQQEVEISATEAYQ